MKKLFLSALMTVLLLCVSCNQYSDLNDGLYADIQTNKGNIVVELFYDKTPITVANFVTLSEGKNDFVIDSLKGKPFYNNVVFHRVIKDFMIQGGDPTATGAGSPGYNFKDEIISDLVFDKKGQLAMANSGANTNGSQFFITQKATEWLTGKHTIFGQVVKGDAVIDTIANVQTEQDKPKNDIVINNINIIRKGENAQSFDAIKVFSDYMIEQQKEKEAIEKAQKQAKEQLIADFTTQMPQAKPLSNGVKFFILNKGNGKKPKQESTVLVNYAGYLHNGELFDSNIKEIAQKFGKYDQLREMQGGYYSFPMHYSKDTQLIPGFKMALLSMHFGDKIRVFIPSEQGYGNREISGLIPANSDLIFDIELIEETKK